MIITAFIEKENKSRIVNMDPKGTVLLLLEELKINPVTVIVSKDNEIMLEDDVLHDRDSIRITSVISGG